jgi:acyl-CoA thioesterase FadM
MRLLSTLLKAARDPRLGPLDESVLPMRVWPHDLDFNAHLNNGRYLSLMDFGRFHLMARMGALRPAVRRRWRPIVGSAIIRFRRSLGPGESFDLRTRVVCWNEKWVFFEQRFERHRKIVATGLVKGLLRGPDGNVPMSEVMRLIGHEGLASPPFPEAVELWQRMEAIAGESAPGSLA